VVGLRLEGNLVIILLFFKAHQHKAAGVKIKLSKNNDHDGYHTASNVARKALKRDKRWYRNTVSLVSSVTALKQFLKLKQFLGSALWRTGSRCRRFQLPLAKKIWEAKSAPYFTVLFAAALFAAEHTSLVVVVIIINIIILYIVLYCIVYISNSSSSSSSMHSVVHWRMLLYCELEARCSVCDSLAMGNKTFPRDDGTD